MKRIVETFTIPIEVTCIADTDSTESMESIRTVCRIAAERMLSTNLCIHENPRDNFDTAIGKFDMWYRTDMIISLDSFKAVCKECGLRVKVRKDTHDPNMVEATAYLDSDILREKSDSLCNWYGWTDANPEVSAYDALWKQSNGTYRINGIDLGDCPMPIRSIGQLQTICMNAMNAIHRIEKDTNFRPRCINLNDGQPQD